MMRDYIKGVVGAIVAAVAFVTLMLAVVGSSREKSAAVPKTSLPSAAAQIPAPAPMSVSYMRDEPSSESSSPMRTFRSSDSPVTSSPERDPPSGGSTSSETPKDTSVDRSRTDSDNQAALDRMKRENEQALEKMRNDNEQMRRDNELAMEANRRALEDQRVEMERQKREAEDNEPVYYKCNYCGQRQVGGTRRSHTEPSLEGCSDSYGKGKHNWTRMF